MEMDRVALIDVASEDDLLVPCATTSFSFTDPSPSSDPQSRGCRDLKLSAGRQEKTIATTSPEVEHVSVQPNASKSKLSSSGTFNLRKSLAWDRAFFTNEGVLDPEELAVINCTFGKQEASGLPSIHEDVMKSTDSISTVGSGSWTTIESLELDLFDSLRAPVQTSQVVCGGSSTQGQMGKGNGTKRGGQASQKNAISAKNVRIPPTTSKKGANLYPTSKQATSHDVPTGHEKSKPPKASSRVQSKIPTPQLPQVKKSVTSLKSPGNSLTAESSNVATPGGAFAVTRRLSAINTSSGSQLYSKMLPRVSSLNTKQGASSSDPAPAISGSLGQVRKKVDKSSATTSSNSLLKSPFVSSKNSKSGTKEVNGQRAQLKYPARYLSGISPSSSIESLASESSSSSTSTVRKSDHLVNSDMLQMYELCKADDSSSVREDVVRTSRNQIGKISPESSVSESSSSSSSGHPVSANGNSSLKISKPSGLRMPSPKIGYFDVDKSLPCESTRSSQGGSKTIVTRNMSISDHSIGSIRPKSVISQSSPRPNSSMDLSMLSCIQSGAKPTTPALLLLSKPSIEPCVTPRFVSSIQESKSSYKKDALIKTAEPNEPTDEVGQNSMFGKYRLNNGQGTPVETNSDACTLHVFKSSLGSNEPSNIKLPTLDSASGIQLDKKLFLVSTSFEKENVMPLGGTDYVLGSNKREPNDSKVATIEQLEERLTVLSISSEINAVEDVGLPQL